MNDNPEMSRTSDAPQTPFRLSAAKTVLLCVISLALSALSTLTGGIMASVCTVLACATLSSALFLSGSKFPLLAALPAYAIAALIWRDPVSAIASLDFVIAALVCADAFKKGRSRVGIICRVSASLALFDAAIFLLSLYIVYGTVDADTVRALIEAIHTETTDMVYSSFSSLPEELAVFSYDTVSSLVTYVLVIFPSVFVTMSNILAYFIQRTVLSVCKIMKADSVCSENARVFKISRAAAVVYIASYLMLVFFGGDGVITALSAVLENLIVIFTPGLALFGIKDFLARSKKQKSPFRLLIAVGMVFLLFTMPLLFFGLSAFNGALAAFRKH